MAEPVIAEELARASVCRANAVHWIDSHDFGHPPAEGVIRDLVACNERLCTALNPSPQPVSASPRAQGLADIVEEAMSCGALSYDSRDQPERWKQDTARFTAAIMALVSVSSESEQVALWMIANGYATGHGDTIADMLAELEWQAKERGDRALTTRAQEHGRLRVEVQEAADFLRSYFGPVAHDDVNGWSDDDARQVCRALEVALEETTP